ncbi:MAG: histidine--tRNA ligase, partial [Alistipes sp.]|nr:histidine--tRNA ligase [Alistipes sp.]
DVSGVGISFGADRIYDVMVGLNLFPENLTAATKIVFVNLGEKEALASLALVNQLRQRGISAELYPDSAKMKKQMEYANRRQIPYVVIIGSNELEQGVATVKNMATGEQETLHIATFAEEISSKF